MSRAATGSDPLVELCAFRVGDEEYVIDIRRIREIVHPVPVTQVPRAPEWMEGVANLRGEVVPVLDVRRRLGLGERPPSRRTKFLVVHVAGRVLALVVDGVSEVVRIPRSAIGPPPAGAADLRLFLGVCGARRARPDRDGTPGKATARDGATARGAAQPGRLRLLLNVKALLDPRVRAAPAPGGLP